MFLEKASKPKKARRTRKTEPNATLDIVKATQTRFRSYLSEKKLLWSEEPNSKLKIASVASRASSVRTVSVPWFGRVFSTKSARSLRFVPSSFAISNKPRVWRAENNEDAVRLCPSGSQSLDGILQSCSKLEVAIVSRSCDFSRFLTGVPSRPRRCTPNTR